MPSTSDQAVRVAVGPLRAGGVDDVVTGDTDGNVTVFLNNGDGTFAPGVDYATGGGAVTGIAIADVNGDGNPDVIATTQGSPASGIFIFLGDGTGGLEAPYAVPNYDGGSGDSPTALAVGNFFHDGHVGLATGGSSSGANSDHVRVFSNDGTGHFTLVDTIGIGNTYTSTSWLQTADLTGTGSADIVASAGGNTVTGCGGVIPLINNGSGSFSDAGALPNICSGSKVATADFNGDGHMDIAAADSCDAGGFCGAAAQSARIYFGAGDGSFPTSEDNAVAAGDPGQTVAADFNGDGHPDLVVTCAASCTDSMQVLVNNGDGTFSDGPELSGDNLDLAAGQLTGSCFPDIASVGYDLSILINTQTGPCQSSGGGGGSTGGVGANCSPTPVPSSIIGLSWQLAKYSLSPIPIDVVASTRISGLDTCARNESTAIYSLFKSLSVDASPGENGAATTDFSYEITAKSPFWSPAIQQDKTIFSIGHFATVGFDWSDVTASIDQNGDIEFPIAKAESNTASAELINNDASNYLSVQTKLEGDLAATLNFRGYLNFFRWLFQLNPRLAPVMVAAIVANEVVKGVSELGPRFPGLSIPNNVLATYGVGLVNSQLAVQASGSSGLSDKTTGAAVGTVIVAGIGFLIYHAAGGAGGFLVCGPACAAAGAVAARAGGLRRPAAIVASPPPDVAARLRGSRLDLARVAHLYVAPFPRRLVLSATKDLFGTTPVATRVGPIVVSNRTLRPGERVAVAIGQLANKKAHKILLTISGPGYEGRLLLRADQGIAGAEIRLPSHMRSGRWTVGTQDLSSVRIKRAHSATIRLHGRADDRIAIFTVGRRRHKKAGRKRS